MPKVRANQLSEEVVSAAQALYRFEGTLPSLHQDYGYFSAERRDRSMGKTAILLTEGGYGDEGGYEGYNSQVVLTYGRDGQLISIRSHEDFEPTGPLLVPKGAGKDPLDVMSDKILAVLSPREKSATKRGLEQRAARYIAATLSLIEKSAG